MTAARMTEPPVGASRVRVRQPRVHREHRDLDDEGEREARRRARSAPWRGSIDALELEVVEADARRR